MSPKDTVHVPAPQSLGRLLADYAGLLEIESTVTAAKKELSARIKSAMEDAAAQAGVSLEEHAARWSSGVHVVTLTGITTERLDTARLKREAPQIAEQYKTVSFSTRLVVKKDE